jgi:hypothetical protein
VFVGDRLIGLVDSSPPNFESRRLTGTPIELIVQDGGFLAATSPARHAVPKDEWWSLILHAEWTSAATKETIASALEQVEAERQGLQADEDVEVPCVVTAIEDELASPGTFLQFVEIVTRAPVMIADVSNFEPGVMLILGIRSVARRGVTVLVTSHELAEAHLKNLPFNIQESRLVSLARAEAARDTLAASIQAGMRQSRSLAEYLDLPVYDAVRRRRPPDPAGGRAQMLVLCPFAVEYESRWSYLQGLINRKKSRHRAVRMLDIESPRLVGQALYEQIRWNRHCLADLTWWRPNVFFEVGVRLACTIDDPILVIDGRAPDAIRDGGRLELQQLRQLLALLRPAAYSLPGKDISDRESAEPAKPEDTEIDAAFIRHATQLRGEELPLPPDALPPGATHEAVARAYDWRQEKVDQPPHEAIVQKITAQLGDDPQRIASETQTLFSTNAGFAAALKRRNREDWVAAWLYAAVRLGDREAIDSVASATPGRSGDLDLPALSVMGEQVAQALSGSSDPFHVKLRDSIIDLIDVWDDQ